jgi:hypothetical protein
MLFRSYRRAAIALVFMLVLGLIFNIRPVLADVAPPPPPEGSNIQPPVQQTQVRMAAETVVVNIAATTGKQKPRAKVTAVFTMRNLGSQAEQMDVRFPLNLLFPHYQSDIEECPYPEGGFPEISSFSAAVDSKPANVSTIYKRMQDPRGAAPDRDIACWAAFPVSFPPQQDVSIEVTYLAEGYFGWTVTGLVEFPYVMVTGAGWAGTIGSADISIHTPYPLSPQTLMEFYPDTGVVGKQEISWHFEDFEPDTNISATIINPALLDRINQERQNVEKNPQDGEAWGRLGKAFKETIMLGRGFRWDAGAAEYYQLSKEAYQKSVTLLPKDADWHYGYGELLWWNGVFPTFGSKAQIRDDLVEALNQFRLALSINPNHPKTREALDSLNAYGGDTSLVDLSGSKPVFTALTTTPTAAPDPTEVATATANPSPTQPPTETPASPAASATAVETAQVTAAPTQTNTAEALSTSTPAQKQPDGLKVCGVGLLPAGGLVWLAAQKRRNLKTR